MTEQLTYKLFGVGFVDLFSSLVVLEFLSPFNICCKTVLVVLNSLNFCLSEKLISPSMLNDIFVRYSNLGCRFFLFSTLNISCHSLLTCTVSAKRSAVKHMGFPLYVTCSFSLAAFNILYVSWCVSPWVYPVSDSLQLLGLINYFLFYVREIFNYNLFKNFLIPFLFLFFCCS